MTVLVTGGTGFVGGNIVRGLAAGGDQVIAVDIVPPDQLVLDFLAPHKDRITFVKGDIVRPEFIEELSGYDRVTRIVHAAAYTGYGSTERLNGKRLSETNVNGILNILDLGRRLEVQRVIYVSTSAVYRGAAPSKKGYREDLPLDLSHWPYSDPYGFYTITKLTGELLARRYGYLYDMEVAAVRLAQNYGPLERVTSYHSRISLPGQWTSLAAQGKTIEPSAQGTGIADVRRFGDDNIYVSDTVDAIRSLLAAPQLGHDLYNISSGKPLLLDELMAALRRAHPSTRFGEVPSDATAIPENPVILDNARLREETGWTPKHDIYLAMDDFMHWRQEVGSLA